MVSFVRRAALVLVAALTLGSVALPAIGQELSPEQLALARKYIDLTDKANLYETSLVNTGVDTMRTILSQKPDLAEPLQDAISKTLDGYKDRKGELLDQFARLYASRFTLEELQQIVAFYESPTGVKLADMTTAINTDAQTVMKIWEGNLRTEFFAKVKAELKASGHPL